MASGVTETDTEYPRVGLGERRIQAADLTGMVGAEVLVGRVDQRFELIWFRQW